MEVLHLGEGASLNMWPDTCVLGTNGAKLHADVTLRSTDIVIYGNSHPQAKSRTMLKFVPRLCSVAMPVTVDVCVG